MTRIYFIFLKERPRLNSKVLQYQIWTSVKRRKKYLSNETNFSVFLQLSRSNFRLKLCYRSSSYQNMNDVSLVLKGKFGKTSKILKILWPWLYMCSFCAYLKLRLNNVLWKTCIQESDVEKLILIKTYLYSFFFFHFWNGIIWF